jgi:predicted nucleic acid-binding protein
MVVYVESSAIAAWLLDQPGGWPAFEAIRGADVVVSSDLTLVECERTLRRSVAAREMLTSHAEMLRVEFRAVASAWNIVPIGPEVVARAREGYPDDMVRALDAIHLATALTTRVAVDDLVVVTLDHRVRRNAEALGFEVLPA